ncbi:hypothetical protein F5Y17DRAFT_140373 [Xylariaceae sp. FL0594]|nr:hypothetical protein F5Y17DRAFT_140373 [Xylariaceae sp. FL0594]
MDTMDLDHDMDIDVDLVPDEPIVPEPDWGVRSPGEIDDGEIPDEANARVPTKVFIQGLDVMNPNDVKSYVAQHCSEYSVELERIEWIDDNSANLLFASGDIAAQALAALAVDPVHDASQLPPRLLLLARPYSSRPEIKLQVRPALESDKKQAGAASRSRFYLLNPEYDPEERRRRNEARRYRDRDHHHDHDRHSFSRRRGRNRRSSESEEPFDVNLYDDSYSASAAPAKARARSGRSMSPDTEPAESRADLGSYRSSNRGKELFPSGTGSRQGPSRGRSASPTRDRTGQSDTRNHQRAHAIKSHISRQNRVKELFPGEAETKSKNGRLGDKVEDAAALLAKGITLPLMDGSNDTPTPPVTSHHQLGDRIAVPGSGKGSGEGSGKGRLADRVTAPGTADDSTFSIRGAASQRNSDSGFAIKGAAAKTVRELFPDKFGRNAGKELFGDATNGRSRQRKRAGDLFD